MTTRQVIFEDIEIGENHAGIEIDEKYVICGCCGGVFEKDDYKIVKTYDYWVNLESEIAGDEDFTLIDKYSELPTTH